MGAGLWRGFGTGLGAGLGNGLGAGLWATGLGKGYLLGSLYWFPDQGLVFPLFKVKYGPVFPGTTDRLLRISKLYRA